MHGIDIVSSFYNQFLITMKTIAIIILGLFLTTGISAQENKSQSESEKNDKIDKKVQREALRAEKFKETKAIVNNMHFVLEADFLSNQYGYRNYVNSNLNFIMVDSTEAVIQTGRNTGIGYNGVGGLTAKGNITSWKVITNEKKKTMNVEMNVSSAIGFFRVYMNVSAEGHITANLTGNYPGSLIYDGKLVNLERSYAYKGSSL